MQPLARRTDDHSDVTCWDSNELARGRSGRRCNEVALGGEVECRNREVVADHLASDPPTAAARKILAEEVFDQLASSRKGQGLTFVRPLLKLSKRRASALCGSRSRKSANLRTVRSGSSDQKAA